MSDSRPDLAWQIAANLEYWKNAPAQEHYEPRDCFERANHRMAMALGSRIRDSDTTPNAGFDPAERLPAACDIAPELAAQYAAIGKAYNREREAMRGDYFEKQREDEELAKNRATLAELEQINGLRESTYVRHCRNRAGEVISEDAFTRSRDGRAQLEEDTIELALRLEAAGRPALGSGPQAWIVDPISGDARPLVNVRKRAILPTAAAEKRAPVIAALELLLRRRDHKFDLFCTFTGGRRVPLKTATYGLEVRTALQDLHRKLSKLNAQPFMRRAKASIIFRSSELGGLFDDTGRENRDAEGNWTLHTHAHCLIHFERFLPKKQMKAWTHAVWDFWGAHWSIDGALEKVREACKYVVKPGEQKHLNPAELAALDAALFRLHRVQPLGELREQIRARRESCLTVKRERRAQRGDGGERASELVPVVLPDWNARKANRVRTPPERRANGATVRAITPPNAPNAGAITTPSEANAGAFNAPDGATVQGDLLRWSPELRAYAPPITPNAPETPRRSPPQRPPITFRNRVVARLSPAPYFDRVTTPGLLVWSDQRPDLEAIRALPFVSQIVEAVGAQVRDARASLTRADTRARACVSVHTNPVTVRADPGGPPRTPMLPALCKPQAWQKTEICA